MIRTMREDDIDKVMEIWYQENITAHSFIDKPFWKSSFDNVKKNISKSKIYIKEQDGEIIGFIGLSGNYIEALFVKSNFQCKGIGKELLDYCKKIFWSLNLKVYEDNKSAVKFYEKNFFSVCDKMNNYQTNFPELYMEWIK